jgi:hypothetical protein
MKIQGTAKVPDYIQIRDNDFTMIAYFKITNPKTALTRCNLIHKADEILEIAKGLEYGKLEKLDINI